MGPAQWPFTYDRLTEEDLPACVRTPLDHPNPLLLRPACLRSVTLGLWGLGWHPRSIAGIVASRFGQEHGWSPSFTRYDAASRAQFYVRTFCAALADGLDSAGAVHLRHPAGARPVHGDPMHRGGATPLRLGLGGPETEGGAVMWTTGISTGIGYRHPIETTLEPIREAGFTTLEVSTAPQHLDLENRPALVALAQRIGEAGLRVHSLHAPFGHDVNITSPDASQRRTSLERLHLAAEALARPRRHALRHSSRRGGPALGVGARPAHEPRGRGSHRSARRLATRRA